MVSKDSERDERIKTASLVTQSQELRAKSQLIVAKAVLLCKQSQKLCSRQGA